MVDLLIIGQGLAGTSLALQAEKRKLSFHLIDRPQPGAASRVAAGLINPVTGRNLSTTWMAEKILPYAQQWYTDWEKQYGQNVYHQLPVWRIFSKPKEVDRFHRHLEEGNPYVQPLPQAQIFKGLEAPYGGAILEPGGWLDTTTFLDKNRKRWLEAGLLTERIVQPEACIPKDNYWTVGDVSATHVVWCDGFWGRTHPFFPDLPFAPTKGEIMTLEIPDLPVNQILIKGHFLVPVGNQLFRLGATYNWDTLDGKPTEEADTVLLQRMEQLIRFPYRVVDHQAGVRPTVIDRKPLFGQSRTHPHHWLFNGLGSKGSTLGPYWADQFLDLMFNQKSLPDLVQWDRKAKGHNQ